MATPFTNMPPPPPTVPPVARDEPAIVVAPAVALSPAQAPASPALPALQAFGAALHRAAVDERRPAERELVDTMSPAPIAAPPVIAPVADPTPLDFTQSRWPETMIARIEQLRETANAADTRIRLHPDALGHLDVALRRENDTVHVHFTAAEPATARLIADAQPRLAELAEARGLKLGGGQADAGANGGSERRQPATPQPVRPRPASPRAATPDADADTRLA